MAIQSSFSSWPQIEKYNEETSMRVEMIPPSSKMIVATNINKINALRENVT